MQFLSALCFQSVACLLLSFCFLSSRLGHTQAVLIHWFPSTIMVTSLLQTILQLRNVMSHSSACTVISTQDKHNELLSTSVSMHYLQTVLLCWSSTGNCELCQHLILRTYLRFWIFSQATWRKTREGASLRTFGTLIGVVFGRQMEPY